jgi:hypothetical protein
MSLGWTRLVNGGPVTDPAQAPEPLSDDELAELRGVTGYLPVVGGSRVLATIDSLRQRVEELEGALRAAMVLLGDADDKYSENLLDALYDSDDGFALDFYNRVVTGE